MIKEHKQFLLKAKIVIKLWSSQISTDSLLFKSVQVLAIVQAPYSPDFAAVFLPLVQNSEITAPLKNAEGTDPVSNFLAEYSKKTKWKKQQR